MSKRLLLTGLLVFMLTLLAFPAVASAVGTGTVKNMDTGVLYSTIQAAVDAASTGDTIHVFLKEDGTAYTENVDVYKEGLSIIAYNEDGVPIHVEAASPAGHVFEVTADWVTIQGFYIHGATGGGAAGIYLGVIDEFDVTGVTECWIDSNRCYDNYKGIFLESSNGNTLIGNTAYGNTSHSIELNASSDNYIEGNDCSNGYLGIFVNGNSNWNELLGNICSGNSYVGIGLYGSHHNDVIGNICEENKDIVVNGGHGILLEAGSTENNIIMNTCNNNVNDGIHLENGSNDNTIESNTCNNNSHGIRLLESDVINPAIKERLLRVNMLVWGYGKSRCQKA